MTNIPENAGENIIDVCVICQQPIQEHEDEGDVIHSYTSEPCTNCQKEIDKGNYIFVLISDKSEEHQINRLGLSWVVEPEEVKKEFGDTNQFEGEKVIFIRESKAMKVGLLDERITERSVYERELDKYKEEE